MGKGAASCKRMPSDCCSQGVASAMPACASSTPNTTPAQVTHTPSKVSKPSTWRGAAPTARSTASSRRRSFRPANTTAMSETTLTRATRADTASKAFSPTPSTDHSSPSATPGMTPISASSS